MSLPQVLLAAVSICRQTLNATMVCELLAACVFLVAPASQIAAQQSPSEGPREASSETNESPHEQGGPQQTELDAGLAKMLSGATLEGSFTNTGPDRDPTELSREKYTLGEVRKLGGNFWLIPARIQYGEHDVTLPITVPIEWAGDTPVIVVDDLPLPGFGTVSARVMFFADHYAGYWKHGARGGHLFGTIRRGDAATEAAERKTDD